MGQVSGAPLRHLFNAPQCEANIGCGVVGSICPRHGTLTLGKLLTMLDLDLGPGCSQAKAFNTLISGPLGTTCVPLAYDSKCRLHQGFRDGFRTLLSAFPSKVVESYVNCVASKKGGRAAGWMMAACLRAIFLFLLFGTF